MGYPGHEILKAHMGAHPVTTVAALRDLGVTVHGLRSAVATGDLVRHAYGIVCTPEAELHGDFDRVAACMGTGGIICSATAGMIHGLTDDMPGQIHVLVPFASGLSREPKGQPIRYVRSRIPESFTLGIEEVAALGTTYRITNKARTVVDLMRGDVRQHAVAAVHTYLAEGGTGDELGKMAEPFNAWPKLSPLVEGTLLAMSRSFGRP